MGRAIVREPQVFLMDEPLSNLDAKLRVQMRADIAELQARLGVTTVYVTHDQAEAMTLGHRVAVLRDAKLQQCDTPRALFDHPVNTFVAGFVGSPAMNLCRVPLNADGNAAFGGLPLELPGLRANGRTEAIVGVRPEAMELASEGLDAGVEVIEELGSDAFVFFHVAAPRVTIESRAASEDEASLLVEEDAFFTARVEAMSSAQVGAPLQLAVDPSTFHFFDLQTGRTLLPTTS
jgi:multiple sugar transport system ATP-binding protein